MTKTLATSRFGHSVLRVWCLFEIWCLGFGAWRLRFGAWCLEFVDRPHDPDERHSDAYK